MSLLTLNKVCFSYGTNEILNDIDLTITPDTRLGLIGGNGSGKSTLLKIIAGKLEAMAGDVFRMPRLRVGYLTQMTFGDGVGTTIELAMSGHPLYETKCRLAELEKSDHASPEYIRLLSKFESQGGFDLRQKAEVVLTGLGFKNRDIDRPASELSGGERERAYIAKLLIGEPDLFLLDEPTNNIDFDGLEWLAEFLRNGKIPYIIVSHDRYFLDLVTTHTAELVAKSLFIEVGNYTGSIEARNLRREHQMKEFRRQQDMIAKEEEFIRRNLEGQKTKQAKSRRKRLEKIELIDRPVKEQILEFEFQPTLRSGDDVLKIRDLDLHIAGRKLLEPFSTVLSRGEKIGIFGPNGAGKSTLIRKLADTAPSNIFTAEKTSRMGGQIQWGTNILVGYFEQGVEHVDVSKSPFEVVHDFDPSMNDGQIRSLLAVFGIRGDDAFRALGGFSGGERAKLEMLILLISGANVLILDEPTNHLDIVAMQALEEAIAQYGGTCIIVSHDRYFMRNTVEKIWAFRDGELEICEGGIDYYIETRNRKREPKSELQSSQKDDTSADKKSDKLKCKPRKSSQKLRFQLERLEKEIERLEDDVEKTSELMGLPVVLASADRMKAVLRDHENIKARLATKLEEWESIACDVEELSSGQ